MSFKKYKKQILSAANQSLINKFKFYLKVEKGLSKNSIEAYTNDVYHFAIFYKEFPLREVYPEKVADYINHLFRKGEEDATVARKNSSLKSFYKFLYSEKIIKNPVFEQFPSPKVSLKLPNVLSVREVNELINSVKVNDKYGIRDRAILEFLYSTGARISEMLDLRVGDIIFPEGLVRLTGKGRKERLVPITGIASEYCKEYLENARGDLLKWKNSNIMFLNRFGNKLSRMGAWKIFDKYVRMAGISKKVSPHTLRHSFATHLLQGGANLRIVQSLLGHSSIKTTQIYTNIDKEYLKEIHSLYHPRA
ncbi:MAG: site-specific tyrosine recombinase XerD [Candidatus Cloacimonadota bacterium]|nr:site-specific tyrosine recombinase XerD [Candidatus Cloacimonadota bacterium]